MKRSLFLSHPDFLHHGIASHPENVERLKAILGAFEESPHRQFLDLSYNQLATSEEIAQIHDPAYINLVTSLEGKSVNLDAETPLSPGSVKAAFLAAGHGIELVRQVLQGDIQNGFALVRPPGHHARPAVGMGFCVFNNIAIAAKKAMSMGIKRILILDWDVHHGNGTQESFYDDDRVLFIDIHQDNLFPVSSGRLRDTGSGKGAGFTVNVPLSKGCRDADYLYVFDSLVKPLALEYRPELILVSAGFDAHESDPLGFMNLTTPGFGMLAARVKSLAETVCEGKLIFFLEGGYDPIFLAKNVMECVNVLANQGATQPIETVHPVTYGLEGLIHDIHNLRKLTS